MTFLEKTTNAYREAMMKKGVSEDVVNYCLFAFETGFSAGTFKDSDIELQEKMIKLILGES